MYYKKLLSLTASILLISSCGGGGGGGGDSSPTPTTPTPTVNLSADPVSVLLGSTSTLTWSSTNATSCSASWTSQTGSSGSEAVTISTAGNNSFSITCSGAGGSRSSTVIVEGYRNTDGVVVDGYISGAEVCIDEDESWTCDTSESSTTSDNIDITPYRSIDFVFDYRTEGMFIKDGFLVEFSNNGVYLSSC